LRSVAVLIPAAEKGIIDDLTERQSGQTYMITEQVVRRKESPFGVEGA
jgi:hypothetical protein